MSVCLSVRLSVCLSVITLPPTLVTYSLTQLTCRVWPSGGVVGCMCNSSWQHTISTDKQWDVWQALCILHVCDRWSDVGMMAETAAWRWTKGPLSVGLRDETGPSPESEISGHWCMTPRERFFPKFSAKRTCMMGARRSSIRQVSSTWGMKLLSGHQASLGD